MAVAKTVLPVIPAVSGVSNVTASQSFPAPQACSGGVQQAPVPELAALPRPGSMVCRIASVDARGRVAEQSVVRALGWVEGQRLDIRVASGVIVVRADVAGVFALARRRHVPIPAAVRRWCALVAGDRVLLAVEEKQGVLLVHTMAALETMLRTQHAVVFGGEPS